MQLEPRALTASILTGTVVGFALKYFLDKRYVFRERYGSAQTEARKLILYGCFSVLTTLIFWAFEAGFWLIWGSSIAKYAGAIVGLAIGYVIKFELDRRYVFRGNL